MRKPWSTSKKSGADNRLRGRALQKLRARIFAEQPLCPCSDPDAGRVNLAEEVDHIIPLAKGGTYDRENLQGLCIECHEAKTLRDTGRRPKRRYSREIGPDGYPTDPNHPFNRP